MQWTEGDYVEHYDFPGVVWQVFEVTQIGSVTLNLWHQPRDFEPPRDRRFEFEIIKSGEIIEPDQLYGANPAKVEDLSKVKRL